MPQESPKRALIVEDTHDLRTLLEIALRDAPFVVVFARDGQEALSLVEREDFDFYLIDIELPYVSGYVVASRVLEKNGDAFVVLTTAYDMRDALPRSRLNGVAELWLKPYSLVRLKKRIACAMEV